MFTKSGLILGVTAVGLMAVAATAPATSQEVTLTSASCFPIGSPPSKPYEALVAEVNKRGKGVVQINMIGGAPAIGSTASR